LRLDPLRVEDAEDLFVVYADEAMYRYTGGSVPTLDELRARFERQTGPTPEGTRWLNWVVRAEGVAVGVVQATVQDDLAEVAWEIGIPWQGKGYASEATKAVVTWLLRRDLSDVRANIHPDHAASQKVATGVGFSLTEEWMADEQVWQVR
jgi:RimJ/RimL family protein N-acetyltransferase